MKKTLRIMLALALVIAALSVSVSATATNGFYDIGSANNVAITAYAGTSTTAITAKEANVDATDDTAELYYEGSDRLGVTYSAATANANYGVILVEGSSLPTASSAIYYIDQVKAEDTSVDFNVYPATITAPSETDNNRDMTLYISSDVAGAGLVSVPMNYVVGYEEVVVPPTPEEPEVEYGNVDGAPGITLNDAAITLQISTGALAATDAQKTAADVDNQSGVTLNDAALVLQRSTGAISKFPVEG